MPGPPRYAPDIPLPPYAYVPGHGQPHPVNDPRGHLCNSPEPAPLSLDHLPDDPASRRRALTALLAADPRWPHAIDLFNEGFSWEAHEAWEQFWHALGRTTAEARLVQGLIHLAAAAVKIREGKPGGITKHTQRARELLGESGAAGVGGAGDGRGFDVAATTLGLDTGSLGAVIAELEAYRPECWHTSRFPVVKVLTEGLRVAG
jgi:hypothetical protein